MKIYKAYIFIALAMVSVGGQTSSSFDLEHNVIAGGGGRSSSPTFTLDGSVGQANAGSRSLSPSFVLRDGFWSFVPLAPTAANVSVSGRVLFSKLGGIPRAFVTITDPVTGLHFQTYSNSFGHYHFSELPAGRTYIVTVSHGRYQFAEPSQTITVTDDLEGLDFYSNIL